MRIPVALIFTLLVAMNGISQAAEEFKSEAGKFSLTVPAPMNEKTQEVETGAGKITVHMYLSEIASGAYLAFYSDYPAEAVKQVGAKSILDNARDGAANNIKGKVTREKEVELDGHPGREFDVEAKLNGADVKITARLFLVDNRLYMVYVAYKVEQGSAEEIDKFLNSFKLLK